MPLLKSGRLLAGLAACLGAVVAGGGCQSGSVALPITHTSHGQPAGYPVAMTAAAPPGQVASAGSGKSAYYPVSRTPPQGALPPLVSRPHEPVAVMLKPVPTVLTARYEPESRWSPAERIGGVMPVTGPGDPDTHLAYADRSQDLAARTNDTRNMSGIGDLLPPAGPSHSVNRLIPQPRVAPVPRRTQDEGNEKDEVLPRPRVIPSSESKKGNNKKTLLNRPKDPEVERSRDEEDEPEEKPKKNGAKKNGDAKEAKNGKDKGGAQYPIQPRPPMQKPPEAPREFAKRALSAYIVEPPDILQISGAPKLLEETDTTGFSSTHLVRPDGTISFANFPPIFVAGLSIEEVKLAIARAIQARDPGLKLQQILDQLRVDVANYNSKFYYVIADGAGYGEQVFRLPYTGNELVLDAIAQIQGLPAVASKADIWVARATPLESLHPNILPVDWCGIVMRGVGQTNYQLYPGDRLYVDSNCKIRFSNRLDQIIAPIERTLGVLLLGASTINAFKGQQGGGGGVGR